MPAAATGNYAMDTCGDGSAPSFTFPDRQPESESELRQLMEEQNEKHKLKMQAAARRIAALDAEIGVTKETAHGKRPPAGNHGRERALAGSGGPSLSRGPGSASAPAGSGSQADAR
eukprot:9089176-Pyramimonas_sp.AAC.1